MEKIPVINHPFVPETSQAESGRYMVKKRDKMSRHKRRKRRKPPKKQKDRITLKSKINAQKVPKKISERYKTRGEDRREQQISIDIRV